MSHLTDRELIAAASKGQVTAFVSLIDRYRDVRTRFAMRMLGDYDTADDALQAAFVRAFQTIGRYRDADRFEEWLFRIIINECRARALRRTVQSRRPSGEVDALADWRAAVEGNDNGADVQRALDQIDPINREAFVLQYVEELAYPQIAMLTGVSVITLERQVDRACARLRELLPNWQGEKTGSTPAVGPSLETVGPSFAVRVAVPLRRPEVLNDSFEDRLMAKLLRAASSPDEGTAPAAQAPVVMSAATTKPNEPPMDTRPPSPATLPEPKLFAGGFKLPHLPRAAELAIAVGLSGLIAFGGGYMLRGRKDARRIAAATAKGKNASPRIVRRTDTVRVARGDSIMIARFVYADPSAKSVALIGDFNRWDPSATPLTRSPAGTWGRTLRLTAGRHEYAYLVDGKRWVTDRAARESHDAFDVASSILTSSSATSPATDAGSASARLKEALPHASSQRVLGAIATARSRGLPANLLENRALKFAAKHVKPSDIEDAIVADAEAMGKAQQLLAAAGRRDPSAEEIDATAQLLGEGADSASIASLAQFAGAGRAVSVPLRVGAELVATSASPKETLAHVEDKVRGGATDAQLEQLLDAPAQKLAAAPKNTKATTVAKKASATNVRQAGTAAKSTAAPSKTKKKTAGK
jgi:RNA polymerase sigma factor (sigma-70 family)